jgi:cation transport ATPase
MKVASSDETGPQLTVSTSWDLVMTLAVSDPLRQEALATIKALKKRGIDVWMISGDNLTTATAVGTMVGIPEENIIASVLPGQKAEKIQYLQKTLKKVSSRNVFGRTSEYTDRRATIAMVGDGINDSPALTMADVGVAIGSRSDIAISSADFILVSSRLDSLLTLIDLSRIVFKRIKFNFAWALVYNLIALPVAAGVLYPVKASGGHIRLDPVWASLAMALSSVSVVCSSLLLRSRLPGIGFRLSEDRQCD